MKRLKLISVAFLITLVTIFFSGCMATLPIPEIKEARFDFSVTYEVDGEEKTYSGVYVCKYDGVLITLVGSGVEWDGYIENEDDIDVPIQTNKDGVVYINFGFFPEYFMGDPSAAYYNVPEPNLFMIYNSSEPDSLEITSEEDVIAGYGARLISHEYAPPIKNTFKDKLTIGRFVPAIN
jgi:hypothetical protein